MMATYGNNNINDDNNINKTVGTVESIFLKIKEIESLEISLMSDPSLDALKKESLIIKEELKVLYRICNIYDINFKKILNIIKENNINYDDILRTNNNEETSSDEIIKLIDSIKDIINFKDEQSTQYKDALLLLKNDSNNKKTKDNSEENIKKDLIKFLDKEIENINEKIEIQKKLKDIINSKKSNNTHNTIEGTENKDIYNILSGIIKEFIEIKQSIKNKEKELEEKQQKISLLKENLFKTTINIREYNKFLSNIDILIKNNDNEKVNTILKIAAINEEYFNIIKRIASYYNYIVLDIDSLAKLVDIISILFLAHYMKEKKSKSIVAETLLYSLNEKILKKEDIEEILNTPIINKIKISLLIICIQSDYITPNIKDNEYKNNNYYKKIKEIGLVELFEEKFSNNMIEYIENMVTNYVNEKYEAKKPIISSDINSFYEILKNIFNL
jgi:hypothetical protein